MRLVMCLFAILIMIAPASATQPTLEDQAIAQSEAAIGQQLPPLTFSDTKGVKIALADLRGKPLLISLVYTGCTDVCPAIIENLRPAIEIGQSALGSDSFTTLTIGFDTRHDTPERMQTFARARGVDLPNWLFYLLTSKRSTSYRMP